jgi:hypothetical protein
MRAPGRGVALPCQPQASEGTLRRAAIWSIDNFHGVRLLVEKIYPFIEGQLNKWPDTVPVGLENECSSHFSASRRLNLPIAAALVVSWSCDHVLRLIKTGQDSRESLKDQVHKTETGPIVHAVKYLLYGSRPKRRGPPLLTLVDVYVADTP